MNSRIIPGYPYKIRYLYVSNFSVLYIGIPSVRLLSVSIFTLKWYLKPITVSPPFLIQQSPLKVHLLKPPFYPSPFRKVHLLYRKRFCTPSLCRGTQLLDVKWVTVTSPFRKSLLRSLLRFIPRKVSRKIPDWLQSKWGRPVSLYSQMWFRHR